MKYIKLDMSFVDRVRFLFLGVIPEERLPTVKVIKEIQVEKHFNSGHLNTQESINKDEEKFVVPFFDFNDEETNSNF